MRFLITMNMPSAKESMVHQITVEHPATSCEEMCDLLNAQEFITCRLLYRNKTPEGDTVWIDRGDLVLNSAHIGKLQAYIEMERDGHENAYGHSGYRRDHAGGPRGPIRPSRSLL